MPQRAASLAAVIGLVLAGTAALAQPDDRARELFRRGKDFYNQGQYEQAIGAFEAAGEVRSSPILDYNIARCHEKLGNRDKAVDYYQRYLKGAPGAKNREEVERRIAELKQPAPASPASQPAAAPAVAESPPPARAVPAPSRAEEPGLPPAGEGVTHEALAAEGKAQPAPKPRDRAAPRTQRPNPYRAPGRPDEGPIYKKWWFWVACAGGAAILGFVIATAATSNDSGSRPPSSTGGLQISF